SDVAANNIAPIHLAARNIESDAFRTQTPDEGLLPGTVEVGPPDSPDITSTGPVHEVGPGLADRCREQAKNHEATEQSLQCESAPTAGHEEISFRESRNARCETPNLVASVFDDPDVAIGAGRNTKRTAVGRWDVPLSEYDSVRGDLSHPVSVVLGEPKIPV